MPIYDQRTEWTAPQNDEKESNKSDTHVSKHRKARDYQTYSYVYKVPPVTRRTHSHIANSKAKCQGGYMPVIGHAYMETCS